MDLNKFKKESERLKMPEAAVYLLKKFQAMHEELTHLVAVKTCHFARRVGHYKTVGGSATEVITIPGVKASMKVMRSMHTEGVSPVTIVTAQCGKDKLTIKFSADPGSDHEIEYWIFI